MSRNRSQVRIIAIAGPKGGIGRTTCTTVLAKTLAMRERSVLTVDTSLYGNMAPLVDLPVRALSGDLEITSTARPRLDYVRISGMTPPDNILPRLRDLPYDDVIIDLRADLTDLNIDLFVRSDLPIVMAAPEPSSIEMITRWIRRSFVRYIQQFEENAELVRLITPQIDSWTFSSVFNRLSPSQQTLWLNELAAFRCAFLLNFRRENSESLQSIAMCHAWGVLLGLDIRYFGSMEFDERRWFFLRQLADVSLFMREDPLVREMDTLVRERLQTLDFEPRPCLPQLDVSIQPREFLRASTPEQARKQYRLLWEGYRREEGLVAGVLNSEAIAQTIAQLEIAYRRSELTPTVSDAHQSQEHAAVNRTQAEPYQSYRSLATIAAISSGTPHPDAGRWLTSRREAAGMTVGQLALKSRIPTRTIETIEQQNLADIPIARLHAYLFEISNVLGLSLDDFKEKFGL